VPEAVSAGPSIAAGRYVQVSKDCEHGVTVDVEPNNAARIIEKINAHDGRLAVIGLLVDRSITISAWRGSRLVGQITLNP
jgi:hypothetical protein